MTEITTPTLEDRLRAFAKEHRLRVRVEEHTWADVYYFTNQRTCVTKEINIHPVYKTDYDIIIKHLYETPNLIDTDCTSTWINMADLLQDIHRIEKRRLTITNVIFNDPATIVFWSDGTKTVVKADNETFDAEKGLAIAVTKKFFGNKGSYYDEIKKWLPDEPGVGLPVNTNLLESLSKLSRTTQELNNLLKNKKGEDR